MLPRGKLIYRNKIETEVHLEAMTRDMEEVPVAWIRSE